jgi:hypothetical protein
MTTSDDAARRSRAFSWLAGALGVAALAAVYVRSPQHALYDSRFALLTSEALLTRGSWDLAPLLDDELEEDLRRSHAGAEFQRHLWQLEPLPDGRIIYRYPPGTPLFSLPFVAAARLAGGSTLGADGIYLRDRELRLQALLAALVTALTVLAVHRLALRELPLGPAATVALVAGLGSPLWSSASRTLWPHTWTAAWVALALLELLRWEDGERRRPVLLALLVSAAFWSRPTAALVAAPIAIFVALRHRAARTRLALTGAAAFAGYLLLAKILWSSYVPIYARVLEKGASRRSAWVELYRLLFSERSGVFVFAPILAAVVLALLVHGIARERRPFAGLALAVVIAHLALYAVWGMPAGTLGQRFFAELTPCFAWLGAHAWRRAREAARGRPRATARRVAAGLAVGLLATASVAAHAMGALVMRWPNLYAQIRQERRIEARGGPPARTRLVDEREELPQWRVARWLVTEWWPGPPPGAYRDPPARPAPAGVER